MQNYKMDLEETKNGRINFNGPIPDNNPYNNPYNNTDNIVCVQTTRKPKKPKSESRFSAPTVEEVRQYCLERKNGVDPETEVTLDDSIKFDLMAGAFASGNADYVTLFEPTASLTELEGKGYVVASVGEAAGEIPYTAYFAKQSYIENNEETIQSFTNAIYKGQQWVKEHTAKEIAESIQSFFPDTSLELLENAVQTYKDIDAWNDTPVLKEESFNRLQEVMKQAGELNEEVPYEEIVNNQYAEKAIGI